MQALDAGHQATTALSVTHARISLLHASNQQRSVRKECGSLGPRPSRDSFTKEGNVRFPGCAESACERELYNST